MLNVYRRTSYDDNKQVSKNREMREIIIVLNIKKHIIKL